MKIKKENGDSEFFMLQKAKIEAELRVAEVVYIGDSAIGRCMDDLYVS